MNQEKLTCEMLEVTYIKKMGRKVSDNNTDLFPVRWHLNTNYNYKVEVLVEAIEHKIPIIQTSSYAKIVEGVRSNCK